MALINLSLIGKLHLQAFQGERLLRSCAYTPDVFETHNETLVRLYKTFIQSDNLHTKLSQLRQVCEDLSIGNTAPYQKKHDEFVGQSGDDSPFDPMDEIRSFFDSTAVDDLPPNIMQYAELCDLAANYNRIQEIQNDGFKKFFPTIKPHYHATDGEGNDLMIPADELPEDTRIALEANQAINNINVEYCLDGYNKFYEIAGGMISNYDGVPEEGWQQCAEAILSLFEPIPAKS